MSIQQFIILETLCLVEHLRWVLDLTSSFLLFIKQSRQASSLPIFYVALPKLRLINQ